MLEYNGRHHQHTVTEGKAVTRITLNQKAAQSFQEKCPKLKNRTKRSEKEKQRS